MSEVHNQEASVVVIGTGAKFSVNGLIVFSRAEYCWIWISVFVPGLSRRVFYFICIIVIMLVKNIYIQLHGVQMRRYSC